MIILLQFDLLQLLHVHQVCTRRVEHCKDHEQPKYTLFSNQDVYTFGMAWLIYCIEHAIITICQKTGICLFFFIVLNVSST